jgi:hypothetical protein
MTDLTTWIDTVSQLVIDELPLQSVQTATVLTEAYLSNIGGWIPDDIGQPSGEGHPNGSPTEQESADAITVDAFAAVYDLNIQATINVSIQISAKLTPGLTPIETVIQNMQNQIAEFITNQINDSELPVRTDSVDVDSLTPDVFGDRSSLGGILDQTIRQGIVTDLAGADKVIDYKALALQYVLDTYGLDEKWNVVSLYTEPTQPIVVQIQKYTDTTYATLDGGNTTIYVISISPDTYGVVSGVILN